MFAREFDKAVAAGVRNAPIVDIDIILTKGEKKDKGE